MSGCVTQEIKSLEINQEVKFPIEKIQYVRNMVQIIQAQTKRKYGTRKVDNGKNLKVWRKD